MDKTGKKSISKKTPVKKRKKPVQISYEAAEETENRESVYFAAKNAKWEPVDWKLTLENIRKMRSNFDAPVDGMGCEKCVDTNEPPEVKVAFSAPNFTDQKFSAPEFAGQKSKIYVYDAVF